MRFLQGKGRKLLRPKRKRKTQDFLGGTEPGLDSRLVPASPEMSHWRRRRPKSQWGVLPGLHFPHLTHRGSWRPRGPLPDAEWGSRPCRPLGSRVYPSSNVGRAGSARRSLVPQTASPWGRFQIRLWPSVWIYPRRNHRESEQEARGEHRWLHAGSTDPDSGPRHCQERLGLGWERGGGAVSTPAVGPF